MATLTGISPGPNQNKTQKQWEDEMNASGGDGRPNYETDPLNPLYAPKIAAAHTPPQAPAQLAPDASVKKPLGQDTHIKPPEDNTPVNYAAKAAEDFKNQLPGYIGGQVNSAQDSARVKLAGDIQSAKESANKRGLLYSGLEAGGENAARAQGGSELAGNIQHINADALGQLGALQNNAVVEAQQEGANQTQMDALRAQASETAYEQALKEQQNQDQFYAGIAGGLGKLIGTGAAIAGA